MVSEIKDTLSGRWWGQGPKVDLFEKKFGKKFGFKYCVMTNSGTAALHLAYILADNKKKSNWYRKTAIVPVLTCTATCHPLKMQDISIIFADIQKDTLTMDMSDMESKITYNTAMIVTVHLGGLVTNIKEIIKIAQKHDLPIIEDACQALGAKDVGYGDFTCFSFQAIKGMSTGDGGMLVCKKKSDYERAKRLRWFSIDREQKIKKNWQAWDRRGITFDQEEIGYKYHPTDIDASIGLVALDDFDKNQAYRHKLVEVYRKELKDAKQVTLLKTGDNADWLFMGLISGNRDKFAERLRKKGIETNVAHIRNDIFTVFGGKRLLLPNMNAIEKKYICLPLNNHVAEKDVRYICKVIKNG